MRVRALLAVLLVLSSCTLPFHSPPKDLPVTVPDEFKFASVGDGIDLEWWSNFGGKELEVLINAVLENNQDLQSARKRLEAVQHQLRITGADLWPQLGYSLDGNKSQRNFIGFPIPGSDSRVLQTRSRSFGTNLNLRWELDLWGETLARKRATALSGAAAGNLYEAARLSLIGQTVKLYVSLIEARELRAMAEGEAAIANERLAELRRRYDNGLIEAEQYHRGEIAFENADAQLAGVEKIFQELRRQIEVLSGVYPKGEYLALGDLPELTKSVKSGLPLDLIERRPDIRAARAEYLADEERVKERVAALFPKIALTASGGTLSDQFRDLLDSDFKVWAIAGNLSQPLIDGGRLRAGVDKADAEASERFYKYASKVLQAFLEVEQLLSSDTLLGGKVQSVSNLDEASRKVVEQQRSRFESGLIESVELYDEEQQRLQRRRQLLLARSEFIKNRIDLHLALGGVSKQIRTEELA